MGFFKSVRELTSAAREMERNQPPVADRMADAMAMMQSSQAMMASLAESSRLEAELRAGGTPATAVVTTVTSGAGSVNMAPVLQIELVVQVPGRTPSPASVHAAIPQHLVHRVAPGAQVPVLVDATGARVALDQAALAAG